MNQRPSGATPVACPAWSEVDRLAALKRYAILDTGREAAFDDIAELAADILDAPIAVVNFLGSDRQWFKAEKGIGQDSLPLDVSICRHAILQPGVFVVPDLSQDPRFEANPLVDAAGGLRFYAGALIETPEGLPLGTVCVLDRVARPQGITAQQERGLKALAAQTMAQLELRRSIATVREESERLTAMFAQATVGMSEMGLDGRFLSVNDRLCDILGRSREDLLTLTMADVTAHDDLGQSLSQFRRLIETGESFSLNKRYVRSDGTTIWANSSLSLLRDSEGRPRAALAVTTDITERVAEERQRSFLLALEDRLRPLGDVDAIRQAAAEALAVELQAGRVTYAEIDEEAGLCRIAWSFVAGGMPDAIGTYSLEGLQSVVPAWRAGEQLIVADNRLDPRLADFVKRPEVQETGARAVLDTPIVKDGRLLGLLEVNHPQPRAWTDAEAALARATAERTWDAVERARAQAALAAEVAAMRKLHEISGLLVREDEVDAVFNHLLDAATELMRADCASVQMLDRGREQLKLLGSRGFHPDSAAFWEWVDAGSSSSCGAALVAGKRVVVPDLEACAAMAGTGDLEAYRRSGIRAVQSTPLMSRNGDPVGMISTHWHTPHEPSESDLRSFDLLARQAADVIERALSRAALQEHETQLRGVLDGMAEGFALLGPDFTILDVNAEALRLETRPREAIVGRTHWEAYPGTEDSELGRLYKRAMKERAPVALEHRYEWPDGRHAWLDMRAYPVGDGLAVFYRDITDRKMAEEALRLANERAMQQAAERSAILGQLGEGVIVADAEGRISFVNEAAERLHGVKMLGVPPESYTDAYSLLTEEGEPFPPLELPLARAVRDGETITDARWRIRRPDGSEVLAIGSARPIFIDGAQVGAVLTLRDDTDRRHAETERARLAALVEESRDFIGVADLKGHALFVNEAGRQMVGLPSLEAARETQLIEYFPEEDRATVLDVVLPAVQTEGYWEGELRFRNFATGEHRPVLYNVFPVRDGTGQIVGYGTVTRDLTERKRAEDALRDTSRRLNAILDNTREAVFLMDERQQCVYANAAAETLTGYTFAQMEGRPLHDVVHHKRPDGSHYPLEECPIDRAFPERAQMSGEELFVAPDGSFYPVAFTASPVLDDEGRPIGTVIEARNIAEEKAAKEQLERLNLELAERVSEAVADREAALAQVHEMQKLETIGQLTGGIAHDFNNLLTPIVGSLDLLHRRYRDDDRAARMLSGALQSAERARVLVSRLLAFARRQNLDPRPVDLAELVEGMRDLIDRSLGPQIDVQLRVVDDAPVAKVDPNQLELALLNLCVNARDAMPVGGTLTIKIDQAEVGPGDRGTLVAGRYVRLSVSDTGIGMDEETARRAIEPFFTTKGAGKGTGLGLSMIHGLAAQSGGMLAIDSEPGRGTTATIWLPEAASPAPLRTRRDAGELPQGRPLSVLLVDDEELVRAGTADMLEALGHTVVQAASGAAALDYLRSGQVFDVLVTDYSMPSMTGVELAREARTIRSDLPALLVTGFADMSAADAAGLPRLPKPFRADDLAGLLDRVTARPEVQPPVE
jgi:PAS domain S-box-containing protein